MAQNKTKINNDKKAAYWEAFSAGNSLYASKKYNEALIFLEKARELDPGNDVCTSNIGICYYKLNKIDKCEQELRKALELNPENGLTLVNLAGCMFSQNKYKDSLKYYRKGLKISTHEFNILFNFSYALYKTGEYKEAERNLEKALTLNGNNTEALTLRAECLFELNKFKDIINILKDIKLSDKNSKKGADFCSLAERAQKYETSYRKQNQKKVNSLCEFIEVISEISRNNEDGILIYRGQRNKFYPLIPSIFRDNNSKANEDNIIQDFNLKADAYFNHEMDHFDDVDKIALMQHHGIPTRLLDFTEAPLVALYFALENITRNMYNVAPCVYVLNLKTFKQNKCGLILSSKQVSSQSEDKIFKYTKGNCAFSPKLKNARLTAQKGLFVLFNEEKALDETVENENLIKIEIPLQKISKIQEELHNLGITPTTIYPDFTGLAQEFKTPRNFALVEDVSFDNQLKHLASTLDIKLARNPLGMPTS